MYKEFKRFSVKKGTGKNDVSSLNAIDQAYSNAGVGDFNLIRVSSILPKGIQKVDDIEEKFGSFLPCVLAEAVGVKNELAAGIAYGFEDDGGGYVVEHSLCKEDIDMNKFDDKIENKLKEMGEIRDVDIRDINIESVKTDVKNSKFGCAVAVLVYLP